MPKPSGVSPEVYNRIERGLTVPDDQTLQRFAALFGVNVQTLESVRKSEVAPIMGSETVKVPTLSLMGVSEEIEEYRVRKKKAPKASVAKFCSIYGVAFMTTRSKRRATSE